MATTINLAPSAPSVSSKYAHQKRQAVTFATITVVTVLAVLVVAFLIVTGQKLQLANLRNNIKDKQAKVASYSDLPDAATFAAHLVSVNQLYGNRVATSKLLTVLQSVTPKGVQIQSVEFQPGAAIKLSARAKDYTLAAKFSKALQAANVDVGSGAKPGNTPFFSAVKLPAVTGGGDSSVSFEISAQVSSEVTNGR